MKVAAQVRRHGDDNILLPQKAVAPPRSEIRDAQSGTPRSRSILLHNFVFARA